MPRSNCPPGNLGPMSSRPYRGKIHNLLTAPLGSNSSALAAISTPAAASASTFGEAGKLERKEKEEYVSPTSATATSSSLTLGGSEVPEAAKSYNLARSRTNSNLAAESAARKLVDRAQVPVEFPPQEAKPPTIWAQSARVQVQTYQNLHNHRVERKLYAIVEDHLIDRNTLLGRFIYRGVYLKDYKTISYGQKIPFLQGRSFQGRVLPFLLSTDLPGALSAPRGEELADVPSEEELVNGPSEEELDDALSEDELMDIPAEEELELVDWTSAPDL
ncbi:hypothetical protein Cgig2_033627 [Carnegiea gigantea]|uniref:Uncharacterized protein n=1 Tax=Carnegiea gigantea TaxID=171969 RepID=A0A9Q1QAL7_9CARY|nr:hypothetical protein Cgig2_033627 [Carnegiea gigantea]